jgi:dephospho-CoA kinase
MEPGGPAYQAVIDAFGPGIVDDGGRIDRGRLGAIVFRDKEALARLEAAVHPATLAEVGRRITQAKAGVVVVEAIKLIEAGMQRLYDALWVVTAPREMQVERLVTQRGMRAEEAALRVDAQAPQEEKAALADRVFVNDGDLAALEAEVRAAWAELVAG